MDAVVHHPIILRTLARSHPEPACRLHAAHPRQTPVCHRRTDEALGVRHAIREERLSTPRLLRCVRGGSRKVVCSPCGKTMLNAEATTAKCEDYAERCGVEVAWYGAAYNRTKGFPGNRPGTLACAACCARPSPPPLPSFGFQDEQGEAFFFWLIASRRRRRRSEKGRCGVGCARCRIRRWVARRRGVGQASR